MTMAKVRAKVAASKVQSICKRKAKSRIERALASPSLRDGHESGAVCLADVALYQAGHRKVRKEAVHITK